MTDIEIVQCFREKNVKKGTKAVYRHYPSIRNLVQKNSGSKEDAEDLFQEVVLVFLDKVQKPEFELRSALGTFLYGIAQNLWLKELRKRGKQIPADWNVEESEANEVKEHRFQMAEQALHLLGEQCRKLLILFYHKRWNMERIAQKLDLRNHKVAKNQKYRCLEKAKANYAQLMIK